MNADGSNQRRVSMQQGMLVDVIRPDGSGLTSIPVTGVAGDIEFPDWTA
jgi:hypothetical protein